MPVGGYGWRRACYETFGWTPWEVMRVLQEYPQEARFLGVDFEETSGYQAEQLEEQQKANGGRSSSSSSSYTPGHISSNAGSGAEFVSDEIIGGDDEVDWKAAMQADQSELLGVDC